MGLFPTSANLSDGQRPEIVYAVGLNTISAFLPSIELFGLPFSFTLYHGFGFWLDSEVSDRKLKRVVRSNYFRRVITTQAVSRTYLLKKGLCEVSRVDFHFGGPLPYLGKVSRNRSSDDFHVCFSAAKYEKDGLDKGYDLFLLAALELAHLPGIHFHIVGNWTPIAVGHPKYRSNFTFHGFLQTRELHELYESLDLIVSPNRPNFLAEGAFDGFPTACCAEAALYGATMMCTDPLSLNTVFDKESEIVIVDPYLDSVRDGILSLHRDKERCRRIGLSGAKRCRDLLNLESQMSTRIRSLEEAVTSLVAGKVPSVAVALRSSDDASPVEACFANSRSEVDCKVVNLGSVEVVDSKYLAFWDDAYSVDPSLLFKQVALLESFPEFDLAVVAGELDPNSGIAWLSQGAAPFSLPVIRSDFMEAVERLGDRLRDPGDLDFWARSFELGGLAGRVSLDERGATFETCQMKPWRDMDNQVLDESRILPRALKDGDSMAAARSLRHNSENLLQIIPVNLVKIPSWPRARFLLLA